MGFVINQEIIVRLVLSCLTPRPLIDAMGTIGRLYGVNFLQMLQCDEM